VGKVGKIRLFNSEFLVESSRKRGRILIEREIVNASNEIL